MKQFAFLLFYFTICYSATAQFTWVNKNPFPDSARFGSGSFTLNGKGYVVGGVTSLSPVTYSAQT